MDRFLYVAMSGAKETLRAQTVANHNLANASTSGFREDLAAFQTRAVAGSGHASRAYAQSVSAGWDRQSGALVTTGRELDVAVQGSGWIAVQAPDGTEAYTRAGELHLDPDGILRTASGHPVLGDGGPVSIPPHASIAIGADGTVSIVPLGQGPETTASVGRIRLVDASPEALERGVDGLFRVRDGGIAEPDAAVKLVSGSLESSNVNLADALVNMIELSRRFDMQVKAMRSAEENGAASARLLRLE